MIARASALHALDRAEHLLGLARAAGLMDSRLADGMADLGDQLGLVASFARRTVLPIAGQDAGEFDISDPEAALRRARADVLGAGAASVDRVAHVAGGADVDQAVDDYVATFALPNLWFHLSMAYAILRANGVSVGKGDFDGLHVYAEGVTWDTI